MGAAPAQCAPHYCRAHLPRARHPEAVRLPAAGDWHGTRGALAALVRCADRDRRWRAAANWPVHAAGRLCAVRRDGLWLLALARTAELLPRPEWRRRGYPLLLRVPLHGRRGWWGV